MYIKLLGQVDIPFKSIIKIFFWVVIRDKCLLHLYFAEMNVNL